VGLRAVRFECDGAATRGDGFIEVALVPERIAQIAVGLRPVRSELDGPAIRGNGFIKLAELSVRFADV
jgi:hypothetical protein